MSSCLTVVFSVLSMLNLWNGFVQIFSFLFHVVTRISLEVFTLEKLNLSKSTYNIEVVASPAGRTVAFRACSSPLLSVIKPSLNNSGKMLSGLVLLAALTWRRMSKPSWEQFQGRFNEVEFSYLRLWFQYRVYLTTFGDPKLLCTYLFYIYMLHSKW